ncbi:MAG TPA: bifunctional hydroxymethylpyrimidine kinase/phosphomethylpyrimidine kinase [Vicinamibacterales bacterium]|nr:bifunctional hydroxymethylpyrimidine kinase/phosphomethylpyrimidine kinase [Vicinamibacterales bacterium]
MKTALTIAGSDSGGGAGIQADLKTFAAHGVYGTSAITAVTAQNTRSITGVHVIPAEFVTAQIEAVAEDIGCDAVKTGMLATTAIVEATAAAIEELELPNLVVDPVMIAKGGERLLDLDAVHALRKVLLRLARVVTPNIPEAEILADMRIESIAAMREAAQRISRFGPAAVLVKGGHLDGETVVDVLLEDSQFTEIAGVRIQRHPMHGTGCTLAAALAARLALGHTIADAARGARDYVVGAMQHVVPIGTGHQPLAHFWRARELE